MSAGTEHQANGGICEGGGAHPAELRIDRHELRSGHPRNPIRARRVVTMLPGRGIFKAIQSYYWRRRVMPALGAAMIALTLVACPKKGPAARAGEKVDRAADKVSDTLNPKGPAEKAGRAIDRAVD